MMMLVVTAVAATALVLVAQIGAIAARTAQAQASADATALAAAAGGLAAAREVADANGAALRSRTAARTEVEVEVGVGDLVARARARTITGSPARRDGLAPAMVAAVARAEQLLGEPLAIVSGYRSPAAQRRLWDQRERNPYPVAAPGTSRHERGLAIDIALWQVPRLRAVAADAGLCHPLPVRDPVHFITCPSPA